MATKNGLVKHILNKRERQILEMLVHDELSVKEIADKLCLAVKTIRWNIDEIRHKYDAPSLLIACVRFMKDNGYRKP